MSFFLVQGDTLYEIEDPREIQQIAFGAAVPDHIVSFRVGTGFFLSRNSPKFALEARIEFHGEEYFPKGDEIKLNNIVEGLSRLMIVTECQYREELNTTQVLGEIPLYYSETKANRKTGFPENVSILGSSKIFSAGFKNAFGG